MKCSNALFVIVCILVAGCNTTHDISANPEAYTDYKKGQVYEIKRPVFLFKSQKNDTNEIPGLANLGFAGTADNLPEFRQRESGAPQVAGLLLPGDRVRIVKIIKEYSFEMGKYVNVFAETISSNLNGVLVQLNLISKENFQNVTIFVDAEQLTLVN